MGDEPRAGFLKLTALVSALFLIGAGCQSNQPNISTSVQTSVSSTAHGDLEICYSQDDTDLVRAACKQALSKEIQKGLDPCKLDLADTNFVTKNGYSTAAWYLCNDELHGQLSRMPSVEKKIKEGWSITFFETTTTTEGDRIFYFDLSASPSYPDLAPPPVSSINQDTIKKFGSPQFTLSKPGAILFLHILGFIPAKGTDAILSSKISTGADVLHGDPGIALQLKPSKNAYGFTVQGSTENKVIQFNPETKKITSN